MILFAHRFLESFLLVLVDLFFLLLLMQLTPLYNQIGFVWFHSHYWQEKIDHLLVFRHFPHEKIQDKYDFVKLFHFRLKILKRIAKLFLVLEYVAESILYLHINRFVFFLHCLTKRINNIYHKLEYLFLVQLI